MLAFGIFISNGVGTDFQHLGVEFELHAFLAVGLHQIVTDILIGGTRDLGHHFHDDDLDTNGGKVASHFKANDTAAHTDDGLGQFLQIQNFTVGDDEAGSQAFLQTGNGRHGSH